MVGQDCGEKPVNTVWYHLVLWLTPVSRLNKANSTLVFYSSNSGQPDIIWNKTTKNWWFIPPIPSFYWCSGLMRILTSFYQKMFLCYASILHSKLQVYYEVPGAPEKDKPCLWVKLWIPFISPKRFNTWIYY